MKARAKVYWTEREMFSREGASIDITCPTRRGTRSCRCEKCDVCGYGKHSPLHGPLFGRPVGSPPYGHEFVPRMTVAQEQTRARILRGLGRR